jgi:hypothetical protein
MRTVDGLVSEKDWQAQVLRLARLFGWMSHHPWSSIHSASGWPDLALCRPPRLILAELKTETGRVSPAQQAWLDALSQCTGIEVYTWRPSDRAQVAEALR